MRTFSRVFNIISMLVSTILACIIGVNRHNMGWAVVIVILIAIFCSTWEIAFEHDIDLDAIPLISWIFFLLLLILACYGSFKDAEAYDKAIDAYNNGRYEEALDGFVKLEGMYDIDDYLETKTVVRLKGTDVEVVK